MYLSIRALLGRAIYAREMASSGLARFSLEVEHY
jgi:hypothetical protein